MRVKNGTKEHMAVETEEMNETDRPLSPDLLQKMDAYWRAANYLSVGQIYLYDNPLLREPLKLSQKQVAKSSPRALATDGTNG